MATAYNIKVNVQSGSDRTIFATWSWYAKYKSRTDHYNVRWLYSTGDGVGFVGSEEETTFLQSTYSPPENAISVAVLIRPIAKTRKVNGKDRAYWTASWSKRVYYYLKNLPPTTPSTPSVEIENLKLTASVDNIDSNATQIGFEIVKNNSTVVRYGTAAIKTTSASYSYNVAAGAEYKVRCRAIRGKEVSEYSAYSDSVKTPPAAVTSISTIKALSDTSVYLDWPHATGATGYDIEYTTDRNYFDSNSNEVSTASVSNVKHAEITGLESGDEYFFRVRATNEQGESGWSGIKSIVIGKKPVAPTTWSSTTTVITGEPLTFYWVHNSQDGSSQTYAELEMYIGGKKQTETIKNDRPEDEKDNTSSYDFNTSGYAEGTKIQWRVRTAGITKEYGDWSVQRTVDVYAPPVLELSMTNGDGDDIQTVTSFPFYISGLAGPNTQKPTGYSINVMPNEVCEITDDIGNVETINPGVSIYSQYFDTDEPLLVEFSPSNIDLQNGIEYTLICTVSMDSGLTAEESITFNVEWGETAYEPDIEIAIDPDTLVAEIMPYCIDDDGNYIEDALVSLYRREFDGSFVELSKDLDNMDNTYVTDPHPALDYARYRVVSKSKTTGAIAFYDPPGYPVGEKAVVIQWDEAWSNFNVPDGDEAELEQPSWAGSMLKLPYNIDVSDNSDPDVSLIEYAGRSHPVAYYGTQKGSTATWNVDIDRTDEETLYGIRRLAAYMGDVYVREPSGSGYWANVKVSYSQTHAELTIPITFNITRVEGGA